MTTPRPKPKTRRKHVVSAGGVVYRRGRRGLEIVLGAREGKTFWALPKGTPEPGESLRDTALREVAEETGLRVSIVETVGSIRYEFAASDGTTYAKRVEHHLMVPAGGSLTRHDGEFETVRWVRVEDALWLLRYDNERDIVERAMRLIERREGR